VDPRGRRAPRGTEQLLLTTPTLSAAVNAYARSGAEGVPGNVTRRVSEVWEDPQLTVGGVISAMRTVAKHDALSPEESMATHSTEVVLSSGKVRVPVQFMDATRTLSVAKASKERLNAGCDWTTATQVMRGRSESVTMTLVVRVIANPLLSVVVQARELFPTGMENVETFTGTPPFTTHCVELMVAAPPVQLWLPRATASRVVIEADITPVTC
jgi:hypothetical protein